MYIEDECDKGRRSFLTGAAGAVVGIAAAKSGFGQINQYANAITRAGGSPPLNGVNFFRLTMESRRGLGARNHQTLCRTFPATVSLHSARE